MSKIGTCTLCGRDGVKLTEDHIQPQCAGNEKSRPYKLLKSVVSRSTTRKHPPLGKRHNQLYHELSPGREIFGGIYRHTQCEDCNGRLGDLYDARFGQWWDEALRLIRPGFVIKVERKYKQRCRYPLSIV